MGDAKTTTGHGRVAAWLVLLGCGGTSLAFNIAHAVGTAAPAGPHLAAPQAATSAGHHLAVGLAVLYGTAPVGAAMGLSHLAAAQRGGWLMRSMTVAVMLGAMGLTIGATAAVVGPVAGALRWLFPAVLDAAALIALQVILAPPRTLGGEQGGHQPGRSGPVVAPRTRVAGPATTRPVLASAGATSAPAAAIAAPPAGPATTEPAASPRESGNNSDARSRVFEALGMPHFADGDGIIIVKRGEIRETMRRLWDSEVARGCIPTGADLNRAAGKDPGYSLGKKYAQEWRGEPPPGAAVPVRAEEGAL